jgi:hypothetical protein
MAEAVYLQHDDLGQDVGECKSKRRASVGENVP